MVIWVAQAGTVNVCIAPVKTYVTVVTCEFKFAIENKAVPKQINLKFEKSFFTMSIFAELNTL